MGNYLASSEVVDTRGLSAAEIDALISIIENNVEYYCQDIFRSISLIRYVDGSGKQNMYPYRGYNNIDNLDIVSISKVEYRYEDGSGALTEVSSSSYWHDRFKIRCLNRGIWYWGKMNYKVQFTLGHEETDFEGNSDPRYLPAGLKFVVYKILMNFLEANYGTTSGTTAVQSSSGPFRSESIGSGDYSYTIISALTNLSSDTPTGFVDIDTILMSLRRRRLGIKVLAPQIKNYIENPE